MRRLICLFTLLVLFAAPVSAQESGGALDWVPADVEAVLRVDLTSPNQTLAQLNTAYFVASFLQPARAAAPLPISLNHLFPVDHFDVENAAFETTILPLLSGELIVAYRALGPDFVPQSDDVLLILPTADAFAAAGVLSAVTSLQDFPARTQYGGATIFIGDQTALAFTPSVVLVGAEPLLHAAIDAFNGDRPRLRDDATFASLTDDSGVWPVSAYLAGDAPRHALSVLLGGDSSALPVLQALGDALQPYNGDSLEAALLSGSVDAVAVRLRADELRGTVEARIRLQTQVASSVEATDRVSDVLAYIPRNAMLVQQGANARGAFYDALVAAPASGYFGQMLGSGFVPPPAPGTPLPPTAVPPDAESIGTVVDGLLAALSGARNFDVEGDLAAYLSGDYALALLPRPNNPLPGSNAPFDVLLVAETGDPDAAVVGATTLAGALLALDGAAFSDTDGVDSVRSVYSAGGEPLLQVGSVDDKLVIGTGGAVAAALRAGSGDNRLVNVPRWQAVSRDVTPTLYLDLNALLATFAPTAGAPVQSGVGQLGLNVSAAGDGRYDIGVIITLPD